MLASLPKRLTGFVALGALATSFIAGCSGSSDDASSKSDSAYTGDPGTAPQAACSLRYWDWVLHQLEPQLARPIAEVSDAQMSAFVATHPPALDTAHSYSICWTPIFDTYVYAPAAARLHGASVTFIDQHSPDYRSYERYEANIAITPELRRNAKALLALRPATMSPTDVGPWMVAYGSILAETVRPVGVPSLMQYEGVVEPEWVITDVEAEYLSFFEEALAAPSKDGVYGEWTKEFFIKWMFGPPPAVTRSFVFNVPWEPGSNGDTYGLAGLVTVNGVPTLPRPVQAFVKRIARTMPAAIGSNDSAAWMSWYGARTLRAIADLRQNQPLVSQTDTMALDLLEGVKPPTLRGAFAYETWLDLYVLAAGQPDASWAARAARVEPCLDAPDLPGAQAKYTEKTGSLARHAVSAPHVCAE